jgi:hypothetical protein
MFKIKLISKMANKAMEEILDKKDLNITELKTTSFMQQQWLLQKK